MSFQNLQHLSSCFCCLGCLLVPTEFPPSGGSGTVNLWLSVHTLATLLNASWTVLSEVCSQGDSTLGSCYHACGANLKGNVQESVNIGQDYLCSRTSTKSAKPASTLSSPERTATPVTFLRIKIVPGVMKLLIQENCLILQRTRRNCGMDLLIWVPGFGNRKTKVTISLAYVDAAGVHPRQPTWCLRCSQFRGIKPINELYQFKTN